MSLFAIKHGIENKSSFYREGFYDGFIGYTCEPPDDSDIYQNEYLAGYCAGSRKKEAIKNEA